jgi:Glucose / Sorbosone dehydrogenase
LSGLRLAAELSVCQSERSVWPLVCVPFVMRSSRQAATCFSAPRTLTAPWFGQVAARAGMAVSASSATARQTDRNMLRRLIPIFLVFLPVASASAGPHLERVGRFSQPIYVTSPPGARHTLAVVERYGRIRMVVRGHTQHRLLADLRSRVRIDNPDEEVDQRGLFSMAFAPDYRRSHRFYVDYVDRAGHERVDELRRGSRRTRRVLDLGLVGTQHHGGQLQFGPDGRLYVSTGKDTPVSPGSLLRLDPRRRPAQPEVYATGLRNPWRFSFDRSTGALVVGDVGDATEEEVDVLAPRAPAGADFGWPVFEGDLRRGPGDPPGYVPPALVFQHSAGWCAVTGGYVVRDPRLRSLTGRYLFANLCSGRLWSAALTGTTLSDPHPVGPNAGYPVSFGQDARGRIYVVSFDGVVSRLRAR